MTPKIARNAPGARVFRRLAAGEGGCGLSATFPEKQARDFSCSARGWSQAMASVMGMKKRAKVFGDIKLAIPKG
jgi:hypothetical protein